MSTTSKHTVLVTEDGTIQVHKGWAPTNQHPVTTHVYRVMATSTARAIEAALVQKQLHVVTPGSQLDITLDRLATLLNTTHADILTRAINTYATLRTNTDTVFYHAPSTSGDTRLVVRRIALP